MPMTTRHASAKTSPSMSPSFHKEPEALAEPEEASTATHNSPKPSKTHRSPSPSPTKARQRPRSNSKWTSDIPDEMLGVFRANPFDNSGRIRLRPQSTTTSPIVSTSTAAHAGVFEGLPESTLLYQLPTTDKEGEGPILSHVTAFGLKPLKEENEIHAGPMAFESKGAEAMYAHEFRVWYPGSDDFDSKDAQVEGDFGASCRRIYPDHEDEKDADITDSLTYRSSATSPQPLSASSSFSISSALSALTAATTLSSLSSLPRSSEDCRGLYAPLPYSPEYPSMNYVECDSSPPLHFDYNADTAGPPRCENQIPIGDHQFQHVYDQYPATSCGPFASSGFLADQGHSIDLVHPAHAFTDFVPPRTECSMLADILTVNDVHRPVRSPEVTVPEATHDGRSEAKLDDGIRRPEPFRPLSIALYEAEAHSMGDDDHRFGGTISRSYAEDPVLSYSVGHRDGEASESASGTSSSSVLSPLAEVGTGTPPLSVSSQRSPVEGGGNSETEDATASEEQKKKTLDYACHLCPRKFNLPNGLAIHLKWHRGPIFETPALPQEDSGHTVGSNSKKKSKKKAGVGRRGKGKFSHSAMHLATPSHYTEGSYDRPPLRSASFSGPVGEPQSPAYGGGHEQQFQRSSARGLGIDFGETPSVTAVWDSRSRSFSTNTHTSHDARLGGAPQVIRRVSEGDVSRHIEFAGTHIDPRQHDHWAQMLCPRPLPPVDDMGLPSLLSRNEDIIPSGPGTWPSVFPQTTPYSQYQPYDPSPLRMSSFGDVQNFGPAPCHAQLGSPEQPIHERGRVVLGLDGAWHSGQLSPLHELVALNPLPFGQRGP